MRPSCADQRACVRKGAEERAEADLGDSAGVVVGAPLGDRPGHGGHLAQAAVLAAVRAEVDLDRDVLARPAAQASAEGGLGEPRRGRAAAGRDPPDGSGRPPAARPAPPARTRAARACRRRRRGTHPLVIAGDQLTTVLADELPLGLSGGELVPELLDRGGPRPAPNAPRQPARSCSSALPAARASASSRRSAAVSLPRSRELTRDVAQLGLRPAQLRHSCARRARREAVRSPGRPAPGHAAASRSSPSAACSRRASSSSRRPACSARARSSSSLDPACSAARPVELVARLCVLGARPVELVADLRVFRAGAVQLLLQRAARRPLAGEVAGALW